MTTPASTPTQRRVVRYSTLMEFVADAEQIAMGEYVTVGKWSFGQILSHLALTMHCSFDGFGFKAPWFARTFIAPFVKNSCFTKPLQAGFKLPATVTALVPPAEASVEDGLIAVREAIDRYQSELPKAPHPFFGQLTREEYVCLTLRHSELHMSFVVPVERND